MDDNILSQLKPSKILGKGSEGVIILTHDSKYTVKIYISNYQKSLMFFNIIQYLQECKLLKTIYKSYLFTQKKNSLDRYKGLVTLFWLYIKKSIIHSDINYDNFFVQKTKKDKLSININDTSYNIKLYDYYLVIGDFGYSKSIEMIPFSKNPDKLPLSVLSDIYNPLSDINNFIKLFKIKFINYDVHNIKINNYILSINDLDYNLRNSYRTMLKSYISDNSELTNNIMIFKNLFTEYMNYYIFSKF